MDLFTQGLLGATMAQTGAQKTEIRLATGIGFIAGLAADADILIQSEQDPLLNLEFHRHFTHSLFFVPLGAFIVALVLWFLLRRRLTFARLYLFTLLGYCLSGVLDAFTSYGTQLLWPLSNERIAWSIISVIDPVFTLILMLAAIIAFKKNSRITAWIGLFLASTYLTLGWFQSAARQSFANTVIAERGHVAEMVIVKPTLGNILLWRSIYRHQGMLYVDAIRAGFLSQPQLYPGESIAQFERTRDLKNVSETSVLAQDIERFSHFSAGLLAIRPEQPNILIDVRYSNLPNTLAPLWGIEIDPAHPDQHAKYNLYRDSSKPTREKFFAMLLGRS